MPFNHQTYNSTYLQNLALNNEPINDAAENYGVQIEKADVNPGETYWRVIGVHHLLPDENWSNHHVYLEALDKDGNRVKAPSGWVGWDWENRQPDQQASPVILDKPDNEPAGNIAVDKNQIISVWFNGRAPTATAKSDKVTKLRTTHPDEPAPDGSLHNTWGHHSFYVVFQETVAPATAPKTESVIFGLVSGGKGRTVQLKRQGTLIQEQKLANSAKFRFENLGAGIYSINVKNANVSRSGLNVDGENTLEVNLSMPAPQRSVIRGTVKNGLGYSVILGKGAAIIERKTLPPDGKFRFDNLPKGVYNLTVWDTTLKEDNIEVNGKNTRIVNLEVPDSPPPQDKTLNHFVLFGPPQSRGRRTKMFIAMDYLLHFSLPSGFSVETAKKANLVTIIGEGISKAEIEAIKQSGAQVEQLPINTFSLENTLNERIAADRPFGD